MYMMKICPEQIQELYYIREELKKYGIKKPITKQVKEAIDIYIQNNKQGGWKIIYDF